MIDIDMRSVTWMSGAECLRADPELFFPSKGMSTNAAKAVCRACNVQSECLGYALNPETAQEHGIWGGTSEQERTAMRRQRRA